MASANDESAEARICWALEINSYDLFALEKTLLTEGYVPDSLNTQTIKSYVYDFRQRYSSEWPV